MWVVIGEREKKADIKTAEKSDIGARVCFSWEKIDARKMQINFRSFHGSQCAYNTDNNWLNEPENTTVISIVHLFVGVAYTVEQQATTSAQMCQKCLL